MVTDLEVQIGQRVRRLRSATMVDGRRMTIFQLAEAAGLTPDYVGKLERGRHMPAANKLVAIAAALQVGVGHLLPPTARSTTDKSEALEALVAVASRYSAADISYLVEVVRVVMSR